MAYQFQHAGDTGLVVALAKALPDKAETRRVLRALVGRLEKDMETGKLAGIMDAVPGMENLLLCYDPVETSAARLMQTITAIPPASLATAAATSREIAMPCCYEGKYAPDLAASADKLGIPPAEVITRHTSSPLEVAIMGFMPGLAYMTGLDGSLALPRLATPRQHVPAGSVGIVQQQSVIYPMTSPGGWNLIGRVPVALFAPRRADPILLRAGDKVQFHAISEGEYARLYAGEER